MTIWTGTAPTLVTGDTSALVTKFNDLRDATKAAAEAWTAYAPTWSSSGTAPAIGNGAIVGGYAQVDKDIRFRILLTVGTTTTFGTGVLSLTLPVAARASVGTWSWKGVAIDLATAQYEWNLQWASSTTCQLLYPNTGTNALAAVSETAPFTFGNGDTLSIQGSYEAA